jgi:two-component system, NarL family, sensor kinase
MAAPAQEGDGPETGTGWVRVTSAVPGYRDEPPVRWARLVTAVVGVAVLVFLGVAAAGVVTARRAAEREAVHDALSLTGTLADAVLEPALEDALLDPDPAVSGPAVERLDAVVRRRLLSPTLIRVKIWSPSGRIVYSDEPRLIGDTFALDEEERAALERPATEAEISDLSRPENRFEDRSGDGDRAKLLEVYRPVRTPGGATLLFETYSRYDAVVARSSQLWRAFAGITLSSMLLLLVAQAPLTWTLVSRVRKGQAEREAWLARAVSASDEERRTIAATLHDGVVQELAASAFLVAGAADRARSAGDDEAAARLDLAAGAVRAGIGGLRSLLVDIYPPALRTAGIAAALRDLAGPLRSRDLEVTVTVPETVELAPATEELIFRVAQECLRNAARHADAGGVRLSLTVPEPEAGPVVLEIEDDGVGFDVAAMLAAPRAGHFGLRLLADQAAGAGADLMVRSAPGAGTRWRLEVATR